MNKINVIAQMISDYLCVVNKYIDCWYVKRSNNIKDTDNLKGKLPKALRVVERQHGTSHFFFGKFCKTVTIHAESIQHSFQ